MMANLLTISVCSALATFVYISYQTCLKSFEFVLARSSSLPDTGTFRNCPMINSARYLNKEWVMKTPPG